MKAKQINQRQWNTENLFLFVCSRVLKALIFWVGGKRKKGEWTFFFNGNISFDRKLQYLKRTSGRKNYRLSTYAAKFSICSAQSNFYLVRSSWQTWVNAAAFQPFLLSGLALPLCTEISAKRSRLGFLDLPLTSCSKSDFFPEDFDSHQNQTWLFSLKYSKIVCVSFLKLFCSKAGEDSELTEKPFSRPRGGQGWTLPCMGSDFQLAPLPPPQFSVWF